MSIVIGWRRNYKDPHGQVTTTPLMSMDVIGVDERVTVWLDKLYSVNVFRGLNLYDIAYTRQGEHSNYLVDRGIPFLFVYPPYGSVEDTPLQWYKRNRKLITQLELTYPKLFESIFVKSRCSRKHKCKRRVKKTKRIHKI